MVGEKLNQTNNYKYLGTLLDPSLSLKDNFNVTYKKGIFTSAFVGSIERKFNWQGPQVFVPIYGCTPIYV